LGIAGTQTGIYALDTPGGWQIIGRTPLKLFDPYLEEPCLLGPGDRLRFVAIEKAAFQPEGRP
jgi:inhibitor of KinA